MDGLLTGTPIDRVLFQLRQRRGLLISGQSSVHCQSHGRSALAPYCWDGEEELFCERCLYLALDGRNAQPVEKEVPKCYNCETAGKVLERCVWCEEKFCMHCMRGDACQECADEVDFPPEVRGSHRHGKRNGDTTTQA